MKFEVKVNTFTAIAFAYMCIGVQGLTDYLLAAEGSMSCPSSLAIGYEPVMEQKECSTSVANFFVQYTFNSATYSDWAQYRPPGCFEHMYTDGQGAGAGKSILFNPYSPGGIGPQPAYGLDQRVCRLQKYILADPGAWSCPDNYQAVMDHAECSTAASDFFVEYTYDSSTYSDWAENRPPGCFKQMYTDGQGPGAGKSILFNPYSPGGIGPKPSFGLDQRVCKLVVSALKNCAIMPSYQIKSSPLAYPQLPMRTANICAVKSW